MKKKSTSFSFRSGYRAGRFRGFMDGKAAGYKHARKELQMTQPEAGLEQTNQIIPETETVTGTEVEIAKTENQKTVHILIISAKNLTSYQIGIHQPLNLLKKQGICTFEVKTKHEVTNKHVAEADMVIVQRSVEPEVYSYFQLARKLGKRTVYVIDDYYEAFPSYSKRRAYFAAPDRRKTFQHFLKHADIVKVDSPYLKKLLIKKYRSNVVYFPASVDFSWIQQIKKKPKEDNTIVIGYEGSNKENDFIPVVPALLQLLKEYGKSLRLEFYGFVPKKLRGHPSVTYVKNEENYRKFIRTLYQCNWDIGLAPLTDNLFNHCKTNNKFREYAACGIPGIYSPSRAYTDWVDHGRNGIIVPHSEKGWYQGIKQLIENPQLRQNIREQAELEARIHFRLSACAEKWRKLILNM